jgi:hypothetical protein
MFCYSTSGVKDMSRNSQVWYSDRYIHSSCKVVLLVLYMHVESNNTWRAYGWFIHHQYHVKRNARVLYMVAAASLS